ncbi:hypothetical protein HN784_04690 [bacterium]|jgi:hypothetical protein|nr:hypothetical protein [bacterium]MBT4251472.1 hypothetical protein [bacterium]MBT4597446.1 hypothetical protein [bacterium]MBT6754285.1 hypothetical protein [bacterium]MBT7037611.1 hypothetical protein [bacterium]
MVIDCSKQDGKKCKVKSGSTKETEGDKSRVLEITIIECPHRIPPPSKKCPKC